MHWVETDFFDQTFEETLALLEETRNHIDMASHGGLTALSAEAMLRTTRDLSYLTSQVTGVMSLLLLHKAVAEGTIAAEDLAPRTQALMDDLDLTEAALAGGGRGDAADLAPTVVALLERGNRLSQRVHRIQDMAAAGAA